jgi:ABC-2 type transport system ATP-binding protein
MEAQRITRPLVASGRQITLPPTLIRAQQIEKKFSEDVGVFDLNFEVSTGTIFGMIGPSGCGKTTTVRLMTGLY